MAGSDRRLRQIFAVMDGVRSRPPSAPQPSGFDAEMSAALLSEVRDKVLELSLALQDLARTLREASQDENDLR